MEALSTSNSQIQAPRTRRADTNAPQPQTSATVDLPQTSDKSAEPVSRLAALAKSVGDEIRDLVPPNSHLQIIQHEETGTFIYRVLDAETGEIVSQYPAEEDLRMLAFWHDLKGLAVDTSA